MRTEVPCKDGAGNDATATVHAKLVVDFLSPKLKVTEQWPTITLPTGTIRGADLIGYAHDHCDTEMSAPISSGQATSGCGGESTGVVFMRDSAIRGSKNKQRPARLTVRTWLEDVRPNAAPANVPFISVGSAGQVRQAMALLSVAERLGQHPGQSSLFFLIHTRLDHDEMIRT